VEDASNGNEVLRRLEVKSGEEDHEQRNKKGLAQMVKSVLQFSEYQTQCKAKLSDGSNWNGSVCVCNG